MARFHSLRERPRVVYPVLLVAALFVGAGLGPGIAIADNAPQKVVVTNTSANPVPVTGSVTLSGTPTVNVGNFPATQPVSGTVNVGNLPAVTTTKAAPATNVFRSGERSSTQTFDFGGTINVTSILVGNPAGALVEIAGGKQGVVLYGAVPGQTELVFLWEGPRGDHIDFVAPLPMTSITAACEVQGCTYDLTVVGY